jgi:Bifunctional DNA primase/polymerase, N-terminal
MIRPGRLVTPQLMAALDCISRAWHVIALAEGEKVPLKGSNGVKDGTIDHAAVMHRWGLRPRANVGIVMGLMSGLWALDVDGAIGAEAMRKLTDVHGPLPASPRVRTGSGSWHLYFKYPADRTIRNRAHLVPKVDARGEDGYGVGPGSIHPNGNAYRWVTGFRPDDVKLVEAPTWLLDLVAPIAPPMSVTPSQGGAPYVGGGDAVDRARAYLLKVPGAVSGQGGHSTTFAVARALVTGFRLDSTTVLSLITEWNRTCDPPWSARELERKILQAEVVPSERPDGYLLDAPRRVA